MQPGDTHGKCLRCLGSAHDMACCAHCRAYNSDTRKTRAERLYVWRQWGGHTNSIPGTQETALWFRSQDRQSLDRKREAWRLNSEVQHRPRFDKFTADDGSSHGGDDEESEQTDGDQGEGHDNTHDRGAEAPQSDEIVGEIRDGPVAPDIPPFQFLHNPALQASREGSEEGGGA